MARIDVSHVSFAYPSSQEKTLRDISFSVDQGAFIAVCGATGSGKSTLMRLLKREIAPLGQFEGEIRYDGVLRDEMSEREAAYKIGYVMQRQIKCGMNWRLGLRICRYHSR